MVYKKRKNAKGFTNAQKSVIRKLAMGTQETHHSTVNTTSATQIGDFNNDNGQFLEFTDIDQGDAQNDRTGNDIFMKWVTVKMILKRITGQDADIRVVIGRSLSGRLSAADMPDVNEGVDHDKIWVYYDKLTQLTSDQARLIIDKSFRINKHARYTSNLGTDNVSGQVFLWLVSNIQTTGDSPTFQGTRRITYKA